MRSIWSVLPVNSEEKQIYQGHDWIDVIGVVLL